MAGLELWKEFRDSDCWKEMLSDLQQQLKAAVMHLNDPNETPDMTWVREFQSAIKAINFLIGYPDAKISDLESSAEERET